MKENEKIYFTIKYFKTYESQGVYNKALTEYNVS